MSTKIYSHYHKKLYYDVGHLDDQAIVYSDSVHEVGYSIGHVDENGYVYNHPKNKVDHYVGRMDNNGKIYDYHDNCIGHVDENGVIYNHPNLELDYEVGHVEGPLRKKASAAYLLLLYSNEEQEPQQPQEPQVQTAQRPQEEYTTQNQYQQPKQKTIPRPSAPSGMGGPVFIFILIVALFCLIAFGMAIVGVFPGILFGIIALIGLSKVENPDFYNVSEPLRKECKKQAESTALIMSLLPVGFGIYSACIGGLAYGILGIVAIVAPIPIFYSAIKKSFYVKNLKKAENGEFVVTPPPQQRPQPTPQQRPQPAPQQRPQPTPQQRPQPTPQQRPQSAPQQRPQSAPQQRPQSAPQQRPQPSGYFVVKCPKPGCPAGCSVPRGKGDIIVTCPKCKTEFRVTT